MINFTIGPVQMDDETLELGCRQIPYFRTDEFSTLMKENEGILCRLFDAPDDSKAIFMTGSGTASMEGGVMNLFTSNDKVLVVNGGRFGHRFVQLCQIHGIPFTEIHLEYGQPLTKEILEQYDNQQYDYPQFALPLYNLCSNVGLYETAAITNRSNILSPKYLRLNL